MITGLRLRNFKAFRDFSVTMAERAILIGPNNAGKTTAVRALTAAALMIRYASNRRSRENRQHRNGWYRAYPFDPISYGIADENVRFEFTQEESSFEVRFGANRRLTAVWPAGDDEQSTEPFFYLVSGPHGDQPRSPREARRAFPGVALIPPLVPVDPREPLLESETVIRNLSTRRSSSHFRNQLWMLKSGYWTKDGLEWDAFRQFCDDQLPMISLADVVLNRIEDRLNVYYTEEGRISRELGWAGDGIQVFLQFLFHVYRLHGQQTVVLDEPDLYLHADLQRRLVRVLDEAAPQCILATHSSEVVAEADPAALLWLDKSQKSAKRAPDFVAMGALSREIGTRFNIGLARVLRAEVALFLEGKDVAILRPLSRTLGLNAIPDEDRVAVVPLGGFSNWTRLRGFSWIADEFLQGVVKGYAILDRDYRTATAVAGVLASLKQAQVEAHVWDRKAIESYVLCIPALARATKTTDAWMENKLNEIADGLKTEVLGGMVSARSHENRHIDPGTVTAAASVELEHVWAAGRALELCDPKDVFARLNDSLQAERKPATSPIRIAKELRRSEIPPEIARVIRRIEYLATPSSP